MNKSIITSAVALAFILGGCSESKTVEQLIISGNDFVQVRDFSSAVIEFKNAVRLEPNSAQARLALGKAYLEQGNYVFAEKELEKAQQLGINQSNVTPLLAQVKTKLAKPEAVYQLIETSADLNDDDYIIVLTYAGIAALTQNDLDRAQDYIGQAITISKTAAYSQVGKAYLARSEQEYSQSLTDIENVLQDNPNLSEALLVKAHLLFGLADYEQAAGAFASYLTKHPMDYNVRYFEINSLIRAELFEQAGAIVDKVLARFKTAPLALHYKAQLQYQKGLYEEAKTSAEQAIQSGATSTVTKVIAGVSSYQLKDYEQAYNHLKPIESFLFNDHPVKKILAVIKLQLGYSFESADSFTAFGGIESTELDFLQRSTASLISMGDFEGAQKLIEKVEKLAPDNAYLSAQKGFVLLSQDNDEGIQSLERAIELDSSLTYVDLALGQQYLKAGDDSKAKSIADKLISEGSDKASGYILQGVIYTKEDNVDKAIMSFKKALSFSPGNVAGLFNLGLLLKEEDSASSMNYFEQVIKLVVTHKGALSNYIALANKTKQLDQSQKFLKNIYKNDNLVLTIALAQNLRLNNHTEEAVALLENFKSTATTDVIYWSLLGDLYLQLKNIDQANTAYKSGLQLKPKHYFLNLRSIAVLELLKKYPEALFRTKFTYANYPNNDRLKILLAHFEMKNGHTAAAKKIMEVIQQKNIKHPLVDSVAGQLAMLDNNFDLAINSFSSAFEQKNSDDNAIQLARSLKFDGQQQKAEKVLEDFVNNNVNKINIRFLLAELYDDDSRMKKIIQYQTIVDLYPKNIIALNNLAWNQYKNGQVALAIATVEQAYKLAPDNITVLETYGVVLVSINKYEYAIKILEAAILHGSSDAQVKASLIKAKASIKQ